MTSQDKKLQDTKLKDRVAIVFGGTSGLGEATAKAYAAEGAKVVVTGLSEDDGKRIVKAIEDSNINVGSQATQMAGSGGSAYVTSKHAVLGFTKQLAFDFGSQGVKVNILSPGFIETPMTEGIEDERLNRIPAQRAGKPEEISALAVFLASDDSNYMHGANVFMDSGWVLGR
ncbi:SDR family NAD(P)-dependent oxidoreductase [Psychrobacter sp. T6-1]|uniref:SDR family NAD(P)-dependent oxidoreductase n=1 Tax=Psychrobacter sp. T6-1 TaxID=3457447 RepID=UPI003FD00EFA